MDTLKKHIWTHLFLLVLIAISGMILVSSLSGINYILRFVIFLAIWYLALIGISAIKKHKTRATAALTILYSLSLLNTLLLINLVGAHPVAFIISTFATITALILAIIFKEEKEHTFSPEELPEIQMDSSVIESAAQAEKQDRKARAEQKVKIEAEANLEEQTPKTKVIKTFSPSRFIASKKGSTFHSPKCDWAQKISERNTVWFNTESAAKKQSYKKCKACL